MTRFKRAVLFAVALLGFMLIPNVPAYAITYTPEACTSKSGFGYDIRVCAYYGWRYQNDGTGVHVENVTLGTTRGCGDLESKAFESVYVTIIETTDHRNIGDQWNCIVQWDLELNGPDNGQAQAVTAANANVDAAGDFDFMLQCTIRPNNPDYCFGDNW